MGNRAEQRAESDDRAGESVDLDDIQSLEAFCKRYPDVANEARLRWWIFHRQANGLQKSGAIVKKAGRWYVVVPRLKDWILQSA